MISLHYHTCVNEWASERPLSLATFQQETSVTDTAGQRDDTRSSFTRYGVIVGTVLKEVR